MSKRKKDSEFEPDPDKLCEHSFISGVSETESKLVECERLADYRVFFYPGTAKLVDGGDASEPRDWKPERLIQYYCKPHFEGIYKNPSLPTPNITFRRIKRSLIRG